MTLSEYSMAKGLGKKTDEFFLNSISNFLTMSPLTSIITPMASFFSNDNERDSIVDEYASNFDRVYWNTELIGAILNDKVKYNIDPEIVKLLENRLKELGAKMHNAELIDLSQVDDDYLRCQDIKVLRTYLDLLHYEKLFTLKVIGAIDKNVNRPDILIAPLNSYQGAQIFTNCWTICKQEELIKKIIIKEIGREEESIISLKTLKELLVLVKSGLEIYEKLTKLGLITINIGSTGSGSNSNK